MRRGLPPCSTPQLLAQNPTDVSAVRFLDTVLFPAARICHGEDSSAILSLKNIDLASMCEPDLACDAVSLPEHLCFAMQRLQPWCWSAWYTPKGSYAEHTAFNPWLLTAGTSTQSIGLSALSELSTCTLFHSSRFLLANA